MNREKQINKTRKNLSIVSALQMYGYEINQFLKLIELNKKEVYIGIDEIESLVLMSVLSFEKVLKTVIIAIDSDITKTKLRNIGHVPKKLIEHILEKIKNNEKLYKNVCKLSERRDLKIFLEIINEMSTIKRRYDKMEIALGLDTPNVHIIDEKVNLIVPDYQNCDSKIDKKILSFLKANTIEMIYILQIILGEMTGGNFQQSLISLFPRKYELNVLANADIDRKFFLLDIKKVNWS